MLDPVTLDFARELSLQYAPANGNSLPFASVQFVPVVSFQVFTTGVVQIMLVWFLIPCSKSLPTFRMLHNPAVPNSVTLMMKAAYGYETLK